MAAYWYETQERAMAPGIADGWPEVIKAPHTKNGRLVRRNGDPSELLEAAKHAVMEWRLHGQLTDSCRVLEAAIAKAEGRSMSRTLVYTIAVYAKQPLAERDDDTDYPTLEQATASKWKYDIEHQVLACLRRFELECDCEILSYEVEDE